MNRYPNPFRFFGRTDLNELHNIFASSGRFNKRADRLHDLLLAELHLQEEAAEAVEKEEENEH